MLLSLLVDEWKKWAILVYLLGAPKTDDTEWLTRADIGIKMKYREKSEGH